MKFSSLILSSLLLSAPFTGHAQASEPAPNPRFYGGLGLYSSSHQNLSSWGDGARIPVQGVVGYQLRPRLAVQLGVAYNGNRDTYDQSQYTYFGPGTLTAYQAGIYTERSTTTSLLARYTLTRKLQHRFQADLLGGGKFEHSFYRNAGTYFDSTQAAPTATSFNYSSTYNSTLLSLGISLRYRVVSHLETVYDLTFDQPISNNARYGLRPQATMALGLRYHFG
ncbi:MAG: hypothetical protein EOO62_28110 [Hymenobacter sp.]|nr:MAG: hypothetical protein EOO62_28110 [Hymenobacter sp.]